MKHLRLVIFALAMAVASSAQVNLTVPLATNVYTDLLVHWLDYGAPLGTLNVGVDSSATTIVVSGVTAAPAVGQSVAIKRDPCVVVSTVLVGSTLTMTVTRSAYSPAVAASHTSGEAVTLLSYATPTAMFVSEASVPWASKNSTNLGSRSVVFGATFQ